MRRTLFFFFTLLAFAAPAALHSQQLPSYYDVLVMINDRSVNSVEIGNYFAQRRNIPAVNMFHFQWDTTTSPDQGETIDSATFKNKIWWPLESYILDNGLFNTINYIVTTKGCPLRVTTPSQNALDANGNAYLFSALSSFDDCIMLACGKDSANLLINKPQPIFSPYCFEYNPVRHFQFNQASLPIHLVTRLDGYTVDQVKALIRRAEKPVHVGQGVFVLDADPTHTGGYAKGNEWMTIEEDSLLANTLPSVYDTSTVFLTNQKNVVGYCSWGSNDPNANAATPNAIPHNTYVNGAIGETYVSTSGRSFAPGTPYGQSLIADLIAEGITGVKGYTDEPLLDVMARPQYLFDSFIKGFNLAESFWGSSIWIAWRQTVIGDPKMTLQPRVPAVSSADTLPFGVHDRHSATSSNVTIYNTDSIPYDFIPPRVVDGDSSEFTYSSAVTLPSTIEPGDSLNVTVVFRPNGYGDYHATLRFPFLNSDVSQSGTVDVELTGTGARPAVQVDGKPADPLATDTIGFPDERVFDSSFVDVAIQNASTTDTLVLTTFDFSGSSDFSFRSMIPGDASQIVVAPGAVTHVIIAFVASDSVERTAQLEISSNATVPQQHLMFVLHGRGLGADGVSDPAAQPSIISLSDGYPNPFTDDVMFTVANASLHSSLQIIDVMGRVVMDLTPQLQTSGPSTVWCRASTLAEGVYVCRLTSGRSALTKTIIHLR